MQSGIHPSKRLGQHFMKDPTVAKAIVDSMTVEEGDHILEIGPGEGVLTEWLIASPAERIIGVEVDPRLASWLKDRFDQANRFELLEHDFLKLDLSAFLKGGKSLRVVGNIPYSITSPILFHVLDYREMIQDMTVTIQKEVGERIVSAPGCKTYGIPSVLFQMFSDVEPLLLVSRHVFYPVPKVDSLVLRFRFRDQPLAAIRDVAFFIRLVKTAFGQRRKMLKNTLKSLIIDERRFESVSIDLTKRPERLSVSDFARLSNELSG